MTELKTELLPVLPLDDAVVLPHMGVTIGLEDPAQRGAIEAAKQGNGMVLLVPRIEGHFARIGTVAKLEDSGQLPTGAEVSVVRGLYRATMGAGSDIGGALWVQIEPHKDPEEPGEKAQELAREYRALIENVLETRGAPGVVQFIRGIKDPGHLADMSGYSPDLSTEQKVEILEELDVEVRLSKLIVWVKETLADLQVKENIRKEVNEGMEKSQRDFILRQ
ncbi:MAG TPA: LON peptidase substrate-binding domain-containing protein, partial [Candidatus Dormibacteraeota bacterium]|nr:LON peptidase substrate-binding domain-containing protein [Candidatus Dormibacteraeota bacterium]